KLQREAKTIAGMPSGSDVFNIVIRQCVVMQDHRLVSRQVEQACALSFGQNRASWHVGLSLLIISLFRTIPAPAKPTTCKARFKGGSNGTARRYLRPGFHVRP